MCFVEWLNLKSCLQAKSLEVCLKSLWGPQWTGWIVGLDSPRHSQTSLENVCKVCKCSEVPAIGFSFKQLPLDLLILLWVWRGRASMSQYELVSTCAQRAASPVTAGLAGHGMTALSLGRWCQGLVDWGLTPGVCAGQPTAFPDTNVILN